MNPRSQDGPDFSQTAMVCVIIAVGLLVIARLLFWRDPITITVQSGTGDFDTVGALAYSQRIAQVAELTIATVLTLGAAVLGLNWYTSKRNFEDERTRITDYEKQTKRELEALFAKQIEAIQLSSENQRKSLESLQADTEAALEKTVQAIVSESNGFAFTLSVTLRLIMFNTSIMTNRLPHMLSMLHIFLENILTSSADDLIKSGISKDMLRRFLFSFTEISLDSIPVGLEIEALSDSILGITKNVNQLEDTELRAGWDEFVNRLHEAFARRSE